MLSPSVDPKKASPNEGHTLIVLCGSSLDVQSRMHERQPHLYRRQRMARKRVPSQSVVSFFKLLLPKRADVTSPLPAKLT